MAVEPSRLFAPAAAPGAAVAGRTKGVVERLGGFERLGGDAMELRLVFSV
jgi:hypothetical protein